MDYPHGPKVIIGILKKGRQEMDSRNRRCETRSWSNKSKEPPAEEHRRHLEDEKGQVTDSPL